RSGVYDLSRACGARSDGKKGNIADAHERRKGPRAGPGVVRAAAGVAHILQAGGEKVGDRKAVGDNVGAEVRDGQLKAHLLADDEVADAGGLGNGKIRARAAGRGLQTGSCTKQQTHDGWQ